MSPLFQAIFMTDRPSQFLKKFDQIVAKKNYHIHPNNLIKNIMDLLISGGISSKLTDIETLVYNMIRDPKNVSYRPDYTKHDPKQIILDINTAIIMHRCLIASVMGPHVARSTNDIAGFINKKSGSVMNPLFGGVSIPKVTEAPHNNGFGLRTKTKELISSENDTKIDEQEFKQSKRTNIRNSPHIHRRKRSKL